MGYHRAGFEVVGVDINPQPRYPFEFIQADAMELLERMVSGGTYEWKGLGLFAAIHASPPCQAYSDLKTKIADDVYPKLIEPVRYLLKQSGLPYVIENVEGAPLVRPIRLCGVMFPGLRVLRHRLFESNRVLFEPTHTRHPLVFTHDKRKAHYGQLDFVQVTGGGNCSIQDARAAMGIDWMNKHELNEAIPPAYAEFIGKQLITTVRR